jgi:hypothetical protein
VRYNPAQLDEIEARAVLISMQSHDDKELPGWTKCREPKDEPQASNLNFKLGRWIERASDILNDLSRFGHAFNLFFRQRDPHGLRL